MQPRTEPIVPFGRYSDYFSDHNVHERLIADYDRLQLFKKALAKTIRPGSCVMDLGAGTGVLTRMALDMEAAHVVAIEQNPHLFNLRDPQLAAAVADGTVELIGENSRDWNGAAYHNKIDVIVSETIGTFGINEGILPYLSDACSRFLKNGGSVIPLSVGVDLFLVSARESQVACVEFDAGILGITHCLASVIFSTHDMVEGRVRRCVKIQIPAGNWMLVVSPRARLSDGVGFSGGAIPPSLGRAVIPVGNMSYPQAAIFTLESGDTYATASLEVASLEGAIFLYCWEY